MVLSSIGNEFKFLSVLYNTNTLSQFTRAGLWKPYFPCKNARILMLKGRLVNESFIDATFFKIQRV